MPRRSWGSPAQRAAQKKAALASARKRRSQRGGMTAAQHGLPRQRAAFTTRTINIGKRAQKAHASGNTRLGTKLGRRAAAFSKAASNPKSGSTLLPRGKKRSTALSRARKARRGARIANIRRGLTARGNMQRKTPLDRAAGVREGASMRRVNRGAASPTLRRARGGRTLKRRSSAERAAGVRWGAELHGRIGSRGSVTNNLRTKRPGERFRPVQFGGRS